MSRYCSREGMCRAATLRKGREKGIVRKFTAGSLEWQKRVEAGVGNRVTVDYVIKTPIAKSRFEKL